MSTLVRHRLFLLLILLFMLGGILAACGGSQSSPSANATATAVATTDNAESYPTPVAQSQELKVGGPAVVEGKFIITVKKPSMSSGGSSLKPQTTNDQFLIFPVTIQNTSNKEENVPSATRFTLKGASGNTYNLVSDPSAGTGLKGTIPAGGVFKGVLVYEVPTAMHTFTVSFKLTSKSQLVTIWDVSI